MAHVMGRGPFASTAYIPTSTHGWVHANTWYAAAPFNSAPPPVPAGVNPQTWRSGQWQPNPFFQPNQGMPQGAMQAWAPHPGWGATVAQNFNPHKRIPNPGDASYWATQLLDNPLGLEGMEIRDDTPPNERHMKSASNGVPHTPWMWVPQELKEVSESVQSQKYSSRLESSGLQGGQVQSQQTEKDLPPPPRDHLRTHSGTRHIYDIARPPTSERVPPVTAPSVLSSSSAYQQQRQQQRPQDSQRPSDRYHSSSLQQPDPPQHHSRQRIRDVSPRPPSDPPSYSTRESRSHTTPSASSSASAAAAAAALRSATAPVRDRELEDAYGHVVFSPKIIRTPDHYTSPRSRRVSHDDVERTPSRTPAPHHGNIYAPAKTPSRSNSLGTRRQTSTPSSTSTSTSTTPSVSSSQLGFLTFTEEPQALLSPLVVGSTPPSNDLKLGREVHRSQSHPTVDFYHVPPGSEREHKVYPTTPHVLDGSRLRIDRDRDRERDDNATPQPPRTPPNRTPPSTQYMRPSPEHGSHHSHQISRSLTYPLVAPPNATSPPSTSPRHANGTSPHSRSHSRPQSTYPPPPSSYNAYPPSRTSPNANANPPRSRGTSPMRHNPLPRPPAVSPYAESLARGSSSASASASAAAAVQQQHVYRRTVRLGYWNRRGDHLYLNEKGERYIVYAPRSLANPEELKTYPSPTEGWMNHYGEFIKYEPVPELLASLPVQGKDPTRPYSSFVQYTEVTS